MTMEKSRLVVTQTFATAYRNLGPIFLFLVTTLFSLPILATGSWTLVGDLNTPRAYHSSTQIDNNHILVTGGTMLDTDLNSAEILDLSTGLWENTASMNQKRRDHMATQLDDGRVLVAGGVVKTTQADGSVSTQYLSSVEIYDPTTASWSAAASMNSPRSNAIMIKLTDGRVLVASGNSVNYTSLTSAEIYDPSADSWTPAGTMLSTASNRADATLLNNGKVFIGPGQPSYVFGPVNNAQIYDPNSNTWIATAVMNTPRFYPSSTTLNDGTVLVAGGYIVTGEFWGFPVTDCNLPSEIYNPSTNSWQETGYMNVGRQSHQATRLPDGNVLAFGNNAWCQVFDDSAEMYDAATGTWSAASSTLLEHSSAGKTDLSDGKILLSGGIRAGNVPFKVSEIYTPSGTPPVSPPRGKYMHVADMESQSSLSGSGTSWVAYLTFTIVDENNNPVYDVLVSGKWNSGLADQCITDVNGQCTVDSSSWDRETWEFTVSDIAMLSNYSKLPQMVYDASANTDIDGDSSGAGIIIHRDGSSTPPAPATTSVHIADLDDVSQTVNNLWTPAVSALVVDNNGNPKQSAWVTGSWGNGLSGFFSCTTDSTGRCTGTYSSSIDTSTAPTGDVTISNITYSTVSYDPASNTDPDGDSDGSHILLSTPAFTPPPTPVANIHISDLDGIGVKKSRRKWFANVTINVLDNNGNAIANATVNGNWSGGTSASASCTTDALGQCVVVTDLISKKKKSVTFTVTDIMHSSFVYDASANSDPEGDSDGTRIRVNKP